jgi:hypothetical protein
LPFPSFTLLSIHFKKSRRNIKLQLNRRRCRIQRERVEISYSSRKIELKLENLVERKRKLEVVSGGKFSKGCASHSCIIDEKTFSQNAPNFKVMLDYTQRCTIFHLFFFILSSFQILHIYTSYSKKLKLLFHLILFKIHISSSSSQLMMSFW